MTEHTIVSCPGKVLLAGGYLVLDPAFSGVVISTSARFYTVVQKAKSHGPGQIKVRSPQFLDAVWHYSVNFEDGILVDEVEDVSGKNKFVHLALRSAISVASEINGSAFVKDVLSEGLDITIVGDNDFYSQRAQLASLNLPRTLSSLSSITPFCWTNVRLQDVHKTGLGSSAALITSLVTALLLHFSAIPPMVLSEDDNAGRRLAHNLAQFVHCLAQGKVGSGFDVSAAAFGSQLYTRFDPAVLHDLMNDQERQTQTLLPILTPSNPAWNYRAEPFKLPPLIRLMLADVDAGSDTPSLVGRVLKWHKEDAAQANAFWEALDKENQSLANTLLHLGKLHTSDPRSYAGAVKYISRLQPSQWLANPWDVPKEVSVIQAFFAVHQISQTIRSKMREMGTLSGVPIEPPEQTRLLDACVREAGIIAGGVPGAGGYDAVWLLVCDPIEYFPDQHPVERVEHVWNLWTELSVSPLSAVESIAKGARIEQINEISGLKNAILRQQ